MSTDSGAPRLRRAPDPTGPFVLGVVGRAGSGKSTVAAALAADGARVIEADRIGHLVTDHDPEVRAALVSEYGPGVYRDDGALDRAQVAALVFRDRAARDRLDRLTHPRIRRRIIEEIRRLADDGFRGVVVVDAALMLEWGLERECHAVLAVVAPEETQIARLTHARGWNGEEARRRLAVQRPNEGFAAAADVTLENLGTPDELARAARAAVAALRGDGRAR
ncbi:MAG: dephospho-CoA kinase [Candidatus Eisenbacteria bacterium]